MGNLKNLRASCFIGLYERGLWEPELRDIFLLEEGGSAEKGLQFFGVLLSTGGRCRMYLGSPSDDIVRLVPQVEGFTMHHCYPGVRWPLTEKEVDAHIAKELAKRDANIKTVRTERRNFLRNSKKFRALKKK